MIRYLIDLSESENRNPIVVHTCWCTSLHINTVVVAVKDVLAVLRKAVLVHDSVKHCLHRTGDLPQAQFDFRMIDRIRVSIPSSRSL